MVEMRTCLVIVMMLAGSLAAAPPPTWDLAGVVQDPQGRPVAGASLRWSEESAPCSEAPKMVEVQEEGLFLFSVEQSDLAARVWIEVDAPGKAPERLGPLAATSEPPSVILRPGVRLSGRTVTADPEPVPVPGVTVRAVRRDEGAGADPFRRCAGATGWPAMESVTGGDGAFAISEMRPGLYDVRFLAPEHIDETAEEVTLPPTGRGGLEQSLLPAARITGRVRDAEGEPVAGARLGLRTDPDLGRGFQDFRRVLRAGRALEGIEAVTDASGEFSLDEVPAGIPLSVAARAEGSAPAQQSLEAIERGSVRQIELTLRPGVRVTGRLVDETGAAVSGAGIRLRPVEEERGEGDGRRVGRLAQARRRMLRAFAQEGEDLPETDAEGKFALEGIPKGRWIASAVVSGSPRDLRDGFLDVPEEGLEDVLLEAELGPAVRGRAVDETGTPLEGVLVRARTGRRMGGDFLREETDAKGRFALRVGDAEVVAWLRAEKKGHGAAVVTDLVPEGAEVEVVLPRAGGAAGFVLGPEGLPLSAFTVRPEARPEDGGRVRRGFNRGEVQAFYDEEGRWRLEDLAPGTWDLTFTAEGLAPKRVEGVEVQADTETEVPPVRLVEGSVLRGSVVQADSGLPIEGARVALASRGINWSPERTTQGMEALTDAAGEFELRSVPPGVHTLLAGHPDYPQAESRGVRVVEGEETEPVVIRLSRGGRIEGTVSESGAPVAGAELEARGPGRGLAPHRAATDASGRYAIDALSPGSWTVTLLGEEPRWKRVRVADGETATVDFVDEAPAVLEGVVSRSGEPVEGAGLLLFPQGRIASDLSREAESDPTGAFRFDEVPPGDYLLQAIPPAASVPNTGPVHVRLEAGVTLQQEVELPSIPLAGVVLDSISQEPVPGAVVMAVPSGGSGSGDWRSGHTATTGGSGDFELDLSESGTWRLVVNHSGHVRTTQTIEVDEIGRRDVQVEIDPEGVLRGQVVDEAGLAMSEALVMSMDPRSTTRTDEGGRFVLDGLRAGEVDLQILAAGAAPRSLRGVPVGAEERTIKLESGGSLLVRVEAAPPVLEAGRLRLVSPDGEELGGLLMRWGRFTGVEDRLRQDGTVRFPHLGPGTWQVVFDAAGGRASGSITVQTGAEAVLNLSL